MSVWYQNKYNRIAIKTDITHRDYRLPLWLVGWDGGFVFISESWAKREGWQYIGEFE